ncbi:MAG: 5-oxoprolinase subunit PxpB [Cellvibrionales bacterium]|nr:5-oxoprolinase subunit PxpB [Cellvibrionales bacterium]
MSQYPFTVVSNSEMGFTLLFDAPVGKALSQYIVDLAKTFRAIWHQGEVEAIPGYNSLMVLSYSIEKSECLGEMLMLISHFESGGQSSSRLIEVPVCYDPMVAKDLESFAWQVNLSVDEVIRRHTAQDYLVHMLGFLPGFLYLGGLDERLHCPRKSTPDARVAPGSVGIGGAQTGVYPVASPGGWHIIGQTAKPFFDPLAEQPFLAKPLDMIRFIPISLKDFNAQQTQVENL